MAVQYVITKAEVDSLMDRLQLAKMRDANINDPYRCYSEEWRGLTDKEKANMNAAVDSIHAGVRMVVVRWLQEMGVDKIGRQ